MTIINLDLSLVDKRSLIHDIIKFFFFNFAAHIMSVIYFKEEFLNFKFLLILAAIQSGVILFYILAEPVIANNVYSRKAFA